MGCVRFEHLFVRSYSHTSHFLLYMSGHMCVICEDEERKKNNEYRKTKCGLRWGAWARGMDLPVAVGTGGSTFWGRGDIDMGEVGINLATI